jgi:predicted nucleic acid-binding protein
MKYSFASEQTIPHDYGLMTNDSLIVAVMQDHKLVHLATNDRDFK